MKKITILILLLTLALSGCTQESVVGGPLGQEVVISLSGDTRAPSAGDFATPDEAITTLRVIGFDRSTGRAGFNKLVDFTDYNSALKTWNGTVTVKTGNYDIVFLANESSVSTDFSEGGPAAGTLRSLRNALFLHTAYTATGLYPLVGVYSNVRINGDNDLTGSGITLKSGVWQAALDRTAAGVSVELTLTAAQFGKWKNTVAASATPLLPIRISNVPSACYVLPDFDNSAQGKQSKAYEAMDVSVKPAGQTVSYYEVQGDGSYKVVFPRIILPENYFSDPTDEAHALCLEIDLKEGSTTRTLKAKLGSDLLSATKDYTVPRNTWLKVTAGVDDSLPEAALTVRTEVADWQDATLDNSEVN